jgi:hypothetical protein
MAPHPSSTCPHVGMSSCLAPLRSPLMRRLLCSRLHQTDPVDPGWVRCAPYRSGRHRSMRPTDPGHLGACGTDAGGFSCAPPRSRLASSLRPTDTVGRCVRPTDAVVNPAVPHRSSTSPSVHFYGRPHRSGFNPIILWVHVGRAAGSRGSRQLAIIVRGRSGPALLRSPLESLKYGPCVSTGTYIPRALLSRPPAIGQQPEHHTQRCPCWHWWRLGCALLALPPSSRRR